MSRKPLKYVSYTVLGAAILVVCLYAAFNIAVKWPEVRDPLLNGLESLLNYDITMQHLSAGLWPKPYFAAESVTLRSRSTGDRIAAEKLTVLFDFRKLLSLKLRPNQIRLTRPEFSIDWPFGGSEMSESQKHEFWPRGLDAIIIYDGTIHCKGRNFTVRSFNISLNRKIDSPSLILDTIASGTVISREEKGPFHLVGRIISGESQENVASWNLDLSITCETWPLQWVPSVPEIEHMKGRGGAMVRIKGKVGSSLVMNGQMNLEPVSFSLAHDSKIKEYSIPSVSLSFDVELNKNRLAGRSIRFRMKDLELEVDLALEFDRKGLTLLDITTRSGSIPLTTAVTYAPDPLMPEWMRPRILSSLNAGEITIDSLRFVHTADRTTDSESHESSTHAFCRVRFDRLEAKLREPALPLKEISGSVEYGNGNLLLDKTKLIFGRSEVEHLSLSLQDVYSPKPVLDLSISGDFQLGDLVRQCSYKETPRSVRKIAAGFTLLTGKVKVELNAHDRLNDKKAARVRGTVLGNDLVAENEKLLAPLRLKIGYARFEESGKVEVNAAGTWRDIPFSLNGESRYSRNPLKGFKAWAKGSIDLASIQSWAEKPERNTVAFDGKLPLTAYLSGSLDTLSFRGHLDLEGLSVRSSSWEIGLAGEEDAMTFEGVYSTGSGLTVDKLHVDLASSDLDASARWDKKGYSLDLYAKAISPCDLGAMICQEAIVEEGFFSGELYVRSRAPGAFPYVGGFLHGSKLTAPAGIFAAPIKDGEVFLRFSDQDLTIEKCSLAFGSSRLNLTGGFENWKMPRGNMTVDGETLYFDDIFNRDHETLLQKSLKDGAKASREFSFKVTANVDEGRWKSFPYKNLRLNGLLTSHTFDVAYLSFSSGPGVYDGTAVIPYGTPEPLSFTLHTQIKHQPFLEFAQNLGRPTQRLTGFLDLKADIASSGSNVTEMKKNLRGDVDVVLKDGVIKKSNVLVKIFALLNVQKMFEGKFPQFGEMGMAYETMSATVTIDKGIAETSNLSIEGADIRFAGMGAVNIADETVDGKLGAAPLVTIDALVSKIPFAGYILTGENKSLLTFYFKIKGPLIDPEVLLIPIQSMATTVFGILKRIFLTPVRLLDQVKPEQ